MIINKGNKSNNKSIISGLNKLKKMIHTDGDDFIKELRKHSSKLTTKYLDELKAFNTGGTELKLDPILMSNINDKNKKFQEIVTKANTDFPNIWFDNKHDSVGGMNVLSKISNKIIKYTNHKHGDVNVAINMYPDFIGLPCKIYVKNNAVQLNISIVRGDSVNIEIDQNINTFTRQLYTDVVNMVNGTNITKIEGKITFKDFRQFKSLMQQLQNLNIPDLEYSELSRKMVTFIGGLLGGTTDVNATNMLLDELILVITNVSTDGTIIEQFDEYVNRINFSAYTTLRYIGDVSESYLSGSVSAEDIITENNQLIRGDNRHTIKSVKSMLNISSVAQSVLVFVMSPTIHQSVSKYKSLVVISDIKYKLIFHPSVYQFDLSIDNKLITGYYDTKKESHMSDDIIVVDDIMSKQITNGVIIDGKKFQFLRPTEAYKVMKKDYNDTNISNVHMKMLYENYNSRIRTLVQTMNIENTTLVLYKYSNKPVTYMVSMLHYTGIPILLRPLS